MAQMAPVFPMKFDPETGQPLPKFDPDTGGQNWQDMVSWSCGNGWLGSCSVSGCSVELS